MLNIFCLYCGELRSEEELHAKGQAHIPRPLDPNACSGEKWDDYMFFHDNPRGLHHELQVHTTGCRKYLNVARHTVTYKILETYLVGERPSVVADGKKKPVVQGEPVRARSIACPAAAASTAIAR